MSCEFKKLNRISQLIVSIIVRVNLFVEYVMHLPDPTSYRDVNNKHQVPSVTMRSIKDYLQSNEQTFYDKIADLYTERFLRSVRVSSFETFHYIVGRAWAEMTKSLTYTVDLSLDGHGIVCEAQCECTAGQGPSAHCKHVVTVLYGLHRLHTDGQIVTEQTCTQVLQTFHHAKPYTGNPLSTSDLKDLRGKSCVFDPRPAAKINSKGYADHFRNTVLGYVGEGRMPVTQLFEPANPYALSDHSFMLSPEEIFLRQEKITEITDDERSSLERSTLGQYTNATWRRQHTMRITASNFGTICKATERKDLAKLAAQLVSPVAFSSQSTQYGIKYESVAAAAFEKKYNVKCDECGLYVLKDKPWLAASPDRIITESGTIVEIKCPFSCKDQTVSELTVPYLNRVDGSLCLDHSHPYYYQVQGQLLCSGSHLCHFVVFTLKDVLVLEVKKDIAFTQNMIAKLDKFYYEHFKDAILHRYVYRFYDSYNWQN